MNRRERLTRVYLYILAAVLLILPVFGISASAGSGSKPALEMLGFYTEAEGQLPSSFPTLEKNSEHITFISPLYYRLGENNSPELQGVGQDQVKLLVNYAHSKNVKVLALVHNLLYGVPGVGQEKAHDLLKSADSRRRFADELTKLAKTSGFDGIMLDIEDIRYEDKDNFSALVKEISQSFSGSHLVLGVALPPETGQFVQGSWARNFDYPAIGKWADRVVVMTYDEHGYSTGPGPVASPEWVERVVKYSTAAIPREKIMLGIPGYGFDWTVDKPRPTYLSHGMALDIASSKNADPSFDKVQSTPVFSYSEDKQKHQVWFEDARSFAAKVKIAEKHDLGGLALWRMGLEDPDIWTFIDNSISVVKQK